jgi:tRNA-specific 2-thiouridylase
MVGLSGGVDSSVAALRLQRAGYRVIGAFIKVWHPDFMPCNWEQERLDAMRVAARLSIPFLTCDAEATYRTAVAEAFIGAYAAGRTPNPDILCNQQVKFGAFLEFARAHGADFVATGHYAQRIDTPAGPELHRGADPEKDQSYFLWTLTPEQLARSLFPIGNTRKVDIRAEAAAAGLPTARKKDSQGICFLGHVDIPEFLGHYITLTPGVVLDVTGQPIGTHQGALVYTLGQRHGFTITTHNSTRPVYYVIDRDIAANTITVDVTPPMWPAERTIAITNVVLRTQLAVASTLEIQIRYRQTPVPAVVSSVGTQTIVLTLREPISATAAGQSCVLYQGVHCLGGGIIA